MYIHIYHVVLITEQKYFYSVFGDHSLPLKDQKKFNHFVIKHICLGLIRETDIILNDREDARKRKLGNGT